MHGNNIVYARNEAMNNTSNCLEVIQLWPYFSSYIYIYIFTEFSDLKEKKHTHTHRM